MPDRDCNGARYVTKPGAQVVCLRCGEPLVLTCSKGHDGDYLIAADEQLQAALAPAPRGQERRRKSATPPPRTGNCTSCGAEFAHVKRRGRRHTKCETCR